MADATITTRTYEVVPIPGMATVVLTASDGEFYTAPPSIGTVKQVAISYMEDTGTSITIPPSVAVGSDSRTLTIHGQGMTDLKVSLIIFGTK